MAKEEKLTGPWRKIHGAVWLLGLAVLACTNWWWPGILVLVGLSSLVEAVILIVVPGAASSETGSQTAHQPASNPADAPQAPAALPNQCPKCGAPVSVSGIHPSSPEHACAYCGARLPHRMV